MPLPLRLAADAVAPLHLAFVLFVMFGRLSVWRWPRPAWLHLPAAGWGRPGRVRRLDLSARAAGNLLRRPVGEAGYTGGSIDHRLWPPLYPAGSTREGQWALGAGAGASVLDGAVYGVLLMRWMK